MSQQLFQRKLLPQETGYPKQRSAADWAKNERILPYVIDALSCLAIVLYFGSSRTVERGGLQRTFLLLRFAVQCC